MARNYLGDIPGNFFTNRIGSVAAVASNGAAAILTDPSFIAPDNIKVLSVWRIIAGTIDNSVGGAASYRRLAMVAGTATTATRGIASADTTASLAAWSNQKFTMAGTPTLSKGETLYISHSTVGGDLNGGTILAQQRFQLSYELL
jgi:hypothetical protein